MLQRQQEDNQQYPSPTPTKSRRRDMTTTSVILPRKQSTYQQSKRFTNPTNKATKASSPSPKIWRTRQQLEALAFAPLTVHKMSSVGNAFASDDLYGSFERSDPLILHPQHTEVLRSSPLSIPEESFEEVRLQEASFEVEGEAVILEEDENSFHNVSPFNSNTINTSSSNCGMTWNPKQNQWVSLVYRYVFPASAFDIPKSTRTVMTTSNLKPVTGIFSPQQQRFQLQKKVVNNASFSFPPPQESIMMGSDSLLPPSFVSREQQVMSSEAEAREACQKLLELIDDEALVLPSALKSSTESMRAAEVQSAKEAANKSLALRSLHSEWSSLPSSPPPPIFHDVCNRPIPELRLSPPMTAKTGKRLFTTAAGNGCTESPLTKRLRMSSSASSSSLA